MTLFSDYNLHELNCLGIIPGPNETNDEFTARANYCLNLKEHLSEEFKTYLGTLNVDAVNQLNVAFENIASTYDISPKWIPIFFSNYKLPFWHGGCAWIFQMTDSAPAGALLQLRQSLSHSPKYLKIYHRDEMITHELAHVGRMKFEEPQFEEILAYQTSPSSFRRWFGPIVQSSYESTLFVLVLAMIMFVDVFLLMFYNFEAYRSALWLKIIPLSMILFALGRLGLRHYHYNKCRAKLTSYLKDSNKATYVIYRLTDHEICKFSKMQVQNIIAYASEEAKKSLRWQLIWEAYFFVRV